MSEARFHDAHVQCLDYQRDRDILWSTSRAPRVSTGCAGAESRKGEVEERKREEGIKVPPCTRNKVAAIKSELCHSRVDGEAWKT